MWYILKGIRTCYPKICCFGILIILSWRQLTNSRHRRAFCLPPFCLKTGHEFPLRNVLFQYQEEENILITGDGARMLRWVCTNKPYSNNPHPPLVSPMYFLLTFPQFTIPRKPTPFLCLVTSPQLETFVKIVYKSLSLTLSLGFSLFYEAPYVT